MDNWTRKQMNPGTEFVLNGTNDRLVVRRVEWTKPGFKGGQSTGWAVLVDGQQQGPAHSTATRAMRYTEQPGVALELARRLSAYVVRDNVAFRVDHWNELVVTNVTAAGVPDWDEALAAKDVENWEGTFWADQDPTFAQIDAYRDEVTRLLS